MGYGYPMPSVEMRIRHIQGVDHPYSGEIQFRSRGNCVGYLHDEKSSQELIDEQGWLATGDVGVMQHDGTIEMLGRNVDKLQLTDGSFFWAAPFESSLRRVVTENSSCSIHQVMLAGNGQTDAVLLVTFESRNGRIATGVKDCAASTVAEANNCPVLQAFIHANLERTCRMLRREGGVKKFAVVDEFTVGNGCVTARGNKLRRSAVERMYIDVIIAKQ